VSEAIEEFTDSTSTTVAVDQESAQQSEPREASCSDYRNALAASEDGEYGSVLDVRAQETFLQSLDDFQGVDVDAGWMADHARYNALVAGYTDTWMVVSTVRTPEVVHDAHIEMVHALTALREVIWDAFVITHDAMPYLSPPIVTPQTRHVPEGSAGTSQYQPVPTSAETLAVPGEQGNDEEDQRHDAERSVTVDRLPHTEQVGPRCLRTGEQRRDVEEILRVVDQASSDR